MYNYPNSFNCRVPGGFSKGPMGGTLPVPSSSFALKYQFLQYLVRVAFVSCGRDGRLFHFRQKNTMVLAHFHSQSLSWPRWLPDAPDASQMASQMLPRCLQDESQMSLDASQIPLT